MHMHRDDRALTLYVIKTSMRKNDRKTCAPYSEARVTRAVNGRGVLREITDTLANTHVIPQTFMHDFEDVHQVAGRNDDELKQARTHPMFVFLTKVPVNNPASSESISGESRPLTEPCA